MDGNAVVSILCNTYNHRLYVRDALEGFVKQKTNFPFEVLVHDDASTDGTADIIRLYEQKYPDLIKPIYQKENQYSQPGGAARVKKLQKDRVRGKYVATCEGDDYWTHPHKLQKQFDFMESHPEYTLCGCSTRWLNMLTGKTVAYSVTKEDRDVTLADFLCPSFGRPFPFVSFFLKTEIWKSRPYWGFPVGDLPLTYYAAMKGKVHMLADNMCTYRWHSKGSWTERKGGDEERAKVLEKMILGFQNMNQDTGYQYNDIITKRLHSEKYMLALMRHDYKAIMSDELKDVYRKRRFIVRISDRIRCVLPGLYRKLQILFNHR